MSGAYTPMTGNQDHDLLALKKWVAGGEEKVSRAPPGQVRLEIRHSVLGGMKGVGSATNMWKNFDLTATIFEVKELAHLHVGTSPEFMVLSLKDQNGNVKGKLLEESLKLGFFNPQDGWVLHIEDRDPYKTVAKYQDMSNLTDEMRYKMTDAEYDKREGTLRDHLRKNPELRAKMQAQFGGSQNARDEDTDKELAEKLKVGERCEVQLERGTKERGEIKWIGKPDWGKGYYVGVQLDLPEGKNNGTVRGQKLFECEINYGILVWASRVEMGDFPEIDELAITSSDEES